MGKGWVWILMLGDMMYIPTTFDSFCVSIVASLSDTRSLHTTLLNMIEFPLSVLIDVCILGRKSSKITEDPYAKGL